MTNKKPFVKEIVSNTAENSLRQLQSAAKVLDEAVSPVRKNFAQRHPTLFALLVTLGASATFLGFEQLLLSATLLQRHPGIILGIGICILAFTGTLYKKLS